MIFIHQIGAALLLVTLTLWLHCGGIAMLITWERRALAGDIHKLSPVGSAILVVGLTARVIAIHGLEVLLWACWYRWLCLSSWESALYFSASSYSTVGGNVVLPPQWRLLGPIESFVAVLMCGVSVSFLVAIATRLVVREERATEHLDSRSGGATRQDA
jgi:voltage-gated potassium channel